MRGRRASAQKRNVTREEEESPVKALLERRGRSFRPLSIVNSALQPFDFDVARAMHAVQSQMAPGLFASGESDKFKVKFTADRVSAAENENNVTAPGAILHGVLSEEQDDDSKTITPGAPTPTMSSPPPESSRQSASQTSPQSSVDTQSGRQASDTVITNDFNSLTLLPPPDISQHPAFATKPKTSTSNAPLMITTSSAAEIRKWAQEKRKSEAERNTKVRFNDAPPNAGGRNAFAASVNNLTSMNNPFNARPVQSEAAMSPYRSANPHAFTGFRSREGWQSTETVTPHTMRTHPSRLNINTENSTGTEAYEALGEGSPSGPVPPKTPVDSVKSASTPVSDGFDQKKSSIRKVTDLFKPKPDKAQDTSPVLRGPDGGPPRTFLRPDLVCSFTLNSR